jgi:ParB-like chromosome segregation protein Spo0J
MLGSRSEVDQKALLGRIVREGLSVRQIEGLVRGKDPSAVTATTQAPARASSGEPEVELQPAEPWLQDLQRRMQIHLGAKVSMANREGFKGRIVIEYHGREDLDRLLELLAPRETV